MILACHNLSKSFGDQVIVKDGSFHIENHEKAALVGLNGAGKSTILKMIVGQLSPDAGTVVLTKGKTLGYLAQHQEMESGNTIYEEVRTAKAEVIEMEKQIRTIEIEPTSGTIIVNGQNLNRMKHRQIPQYRRGIGVVFQDFRLLKDRNIYENIAFAQRVTEKSTRVIKKKVPAALSLVGLAQKYKAFPKELSGGEQQRVAIARAVVNEPAILLADEPTGNLDPTNSWEIMKLLEEANERGTTVLVVTHNQEIVNEMKKRVITMKKGVIVSDEQEGGYKHED